MKTPSQRLRDVGVVFFFLMLVRLAPVWFLQRTLYFGDNYSLYVPGKLFTVSWLQQGIVPLWNPYLMSGISWLGDISQSVFYPSTLFFAVLSPTWALNVTLISHLLLTMVGMYLLAYWFCRHHYSSLIVSVLWVASSQVTGGANNLSTLQSLAWFSWVLYGSVVMGESRQKIWIVLLALVGQVFAGYPQHLLLVAPVAAVLSLMSLWQHSPLVSKQKIITEWVQRWLIVVLVVLGITAVTWMPFVDALLQSTRTVQSASQASIGSLHFLELVKVAVPYFFDAPVFGMRWGPSWNTFPTAVPYITWFGTLVGLLFFAQRKKTPWQWVLLVLAGLSLVIAFGRHLPGYNSLLEVTTIFKAIRYPSSWLVISQLMLMILLAMALPSFKMSRWWANRLQVTSVVMALVAAVGWVIVSWWPELVWQWLNVLTNAKLANSAFHTLERDQVILQIITANVVINALMFVVALTAWQQRRWQWLLFIMAADVLINTQAIMLFTTNAIYQPATHFTSQPHVQVLKDPQYRTLTRNFNQPYTDFGSYWEATVVREPFSDSFVGAEEMTKATHLQRLRDGLTADWNEVAQVPTVHGYVTLLPLAYQRLWSNHEEARINALPKIEITNPLLAEWAVKYYLVDTWFDVQEDLSRLPLVLEHDHWRVYELPAKPRVRLLDDQTLENVQVSETPNRLSISVTNPGPANTLLVADAYDQYWQAKVNGTVTEVTNHQGMRAFSIPTGQSEIELEYVSRPFSVGAVITLLTVILSSVYVWSRKMATRPS